VSPTCDSRMSQSISLCWCPQPNASFHIHVILQCIAVNCSEIQCVAVCCIAVYCSELQCVAMCCNVLQCVAVCCSVMQCVAVCCSEIQCVALCCSVLYIVHRQMIHVTYTSHMNELPMHANMHYVRTIHPCDVS